MNDLMEQTLGHFRVTSGSLRVSDPCYTPDTTCAHTIKNARNGEWNAKIMISDEKSWGNRVARLVVWHPTADIRECEYRARMISSNIGVDSGQAGFFDGDYYTKHHDSDYNLEGGFYHACCNATLGDDANPRLADTVKSIGVCSSSGFGDGCYSLYTAEQGGEVVMAFIDFIGDDDDEDTGDEEE